jgi:hypothetical protein
MKEGTGADQIFCQLVNLINKFDLRLEKNGWVCSIRGSGCEWQKRKALQQH